MKKSYELRSRNEDERNIITIENGTVYIEKISFFNRLFNLGRSEIRMGSILDVEVKETSVGEGYICIKTADNEYVVYADGDDSLEKMIINQNMWEIRSLIRKYTENAGLKNIRKTYRPCVVEDCEEDTIELRRFLDMASLVQSY